MKSEEDLVKIFNKKLDELEEIGKELSRLHRRAPIDRKPEDREKSKRLVGELHKKRDELLNINIIGAKLDEQVNKILNRVRLEILRILRSTNLSETEKQINEILSNMDTSNWFRQCKKLRELEISKKDLLDVEKRVTKMMEQFIRVAEKEIK